MATVSAGRVRVAAGRFDARAPRFGSDTDLTAAGAVLLAVTTLAAVAALDLLDDRLGLPFRVGFVLAAVTAPVAVGVGRLLLTGILPPFLLIAAIAVIVTLRPEAVVVDGLPADAGWLGHVVNAVIDHGISLLIGHLLALGVILARVRTAPRPVPLA